MVAGRIMGGKLFLLDVAREKLDAHQIESKGKALASRYGQAGVVTPVWSYMSGPEIGMAKLMRDRGLPICPLPARYNKLVRAQRTIKRWNSGEILVPSTNAPWVRGFLHRMSCFRGNDHDDGDDEIDALVSLCDGAMGGAGAGASPRMIGHAYSGMGGVVAGRR
jgi:predicted phage terminase large subunit-like protein